MLDIQQKRFLTEQGIGLMLNKEYRLRFLGTFEKDLNETIDYIQYNLNNPTAAINFVNDVEKAIYGRLECPLVFEPYLSRKERKHKYYRIYVNNYIIFYVVIGDVMEVRRLIHKSREYIALI